jgi:hypothetical protein
MNPFSGFLQPPQQRSPLAGAADTFTDLSRLSLARQQEKNRVAEASTDNARADQYLKLQQTDQASRLGQQDQKQVEALLAEYQDAEDQGDPIRLSRAAQMLKRFGMDVAPGKSAGLPGALPSQASPQEANLSQEDFESQLIGGEAGAYSNVEETELASRDALRKRNAATEPDIAGHLKSVGGLPPLKLNSREEQDASGAPVDMGDVDSPEFQKAARDEVRPELKNTAAPSLPGGLPTVISRNGKQLYESTGPSGRWSPMVQSVFQPFTTHANPDIGAAAQRAQQVTAKLIEVDGIAPKDAIKIGMDYLNGEATRITNLARTELGTRPKWGGGAGVSPGKFQALGPKEDRAESIKLYISESKGHVGKLNESDRMLAQAEGLANSSDPALQRNAIDVLVQSRSGATVAVGERARYDQMNGVISQLKNMAGRWTGGPLDPEYVNKIKMVIAEQRRINAATREEVASDLEEAYVAQNEGKVAQPILERRKSALGKTIRRDDAAAPADSVDEESLY